MDSSKVNQRLKLLRMIFDLKQFEFYISKYNNSSQCTVPVTYLSTIWYFARRDEKFIEEFPFKNGKLPSDPFFPIAQSNRSELTCNRTATSINVSWKKEKKRKKGKKRKGEKMGISGRETLVFQQTDNLDRFDIPSTCSSFVSFPLPSFLFFFVLVSWILLILFSSFHVPFTLGLLSNQI